MLFSNALRPFGQNFFHIPLIRIIRLSPFQFQIHNLKKHHNRADKLHQLNQQIFNFDQWFPVMTAPVAKLTNEMQR